MNDKGREGGREITEHYRERIVVFHDYYLKFLYIPIYLYIYLSIYLYILSIYLSTRFHQYPIKASSTLPFIRLSFKDTFLTANFHSPSPVTTFFFHAKLGA